MSCERITAQRCTSAAVRKSPPIQFCQSLLETEPLGVVFILYFWQLFGISVGRDRMYQFCTHPVRTSLCKMVSTGYMIKTWRSHPHWWNSLTLPGTAWNCLKPPDTAWHCLKLPETYWNCMKLPETYWNSLKLTETAWNSLKFPKTAWKCLKLPETPWNSLKLPKTLRNPLKHSETPWNSLKLSETPWNSLKLVETPKTTQSAGP